MRPTHRRLAGLIALTLRLGTAGPAQAKFLPSPPASHHRPPAASRPTSDSSSGWAYAAIAAGGTGIIVLAATGALAASRRPGAPVPVPPRDTAAPD